jgi:uncharacterized protein YndB with AHSA1/START domain
VGGAFIVTDRRDGVDIEHIGEYLIVDRPNRLVFTFSVPRYSSQETTVTIEIAPSGDGCDLVLNHQGVLPDYAQRTESGWTTILGGLATLLSEGAPAPIPNAIVVERKLPFPRERVWRSLTEPTLIAQWLMPNTFAPVLGHRFTFQARPVGDWDGVVECEVLEIEAPQRLRFSWHSGSHRSTTYGSRLETTMTWTLTAVEGGSWLHMAHDGFRPGNEGAYVAMRLGWDSAMEGIERVTALG